MFDRELPTAWSSLPLYLHSDATTLLMVKTNQNQSSNDLGFPFNQQRDIKINVSCFRYQNQKCVSNCWFLCQMRGGCPIIWRSGGADDWSCQRCSALILAVGLRLEIGSGECLMVGHHAINTKVQCTNVDQQGNDSLDLCGELFGRCKARIGWDGARMIMYVYQRNIETEEACWNIWRDRYWTSHQY